LESHVPFAVSVIVPCRNSAETVGAAVRTALAQSIPPLEVLVVDDASTDQSAEVARAAGARLVTGCTRRNAGGARNAGIEAAKGDVLAFLDADVEVAPDWLAMVAKVFDSDPTVVAVGGRILNGRPGRWGDLDHLLNHSEWISETARECAAYPTIAIAYRREAVGEVRFPETNHGEDLFFALAVTSRGGRIWYEPRIRVVHKHQRLNWHQFWERQVNMGRTFYLTRRSLDRPGKVILRLPALLLLYPHLWMVLGRMLECRMVWKAITLFPWLFAGETARILGFFRARRGMTAGQGEPRTAS
jgi:glycosyltransferase involved in cell wall biosynthesis